MSRSGLTREQKKAQTRQRLLDAAAEVFADKGFVAASLDDIADRAGLTKGAVYSNFAGKEALFFAVLDEHVDRRLDGIADAVDRNASLADQAQEAGGLFARAFQEERLWYFLGMEYSVYRARLQQERDPTIHRERLAKMAAQIEETAAAAGLELPVSPELLAMIFNALGNGFALEKLQDPERVPDDLFGTALALIYKGIEASRE